MTILNHIFAVHEKGSYAIRTRPCSPNTLFSFRCVSQKRAPMDGKRSSFQGIFCHKYAFCMHGGASKNIYKKCDLPNSNKTLFQCQGAPGEAASRAHCSDKKQLFEQQLKHFSKFLQKKVAWAQNWCRKLTGLLN